MLLEDGRYEDFRDRVLQWRGTLTWRLCMLGDMPSCPSDFGELLDIVQSPRAETYIALQRLCRDDSPHEFFKAFNSLRSNARRFCAANGIPLSPVARRGCGHGTWDLPTIGR